MRGRDRETGRYAAEVWCASLPQRVRSDVMTLVVSDLMDRVRRIVDDRCAKKT